MQAPTETDLWTIWTRIQAGDERAFRALFDQLYPYLTTTAYQYVYDTSKARDLAQDVFVELWDKRSERQITGSVRAYLRRAVVNKSLNYLKRERRIEARDPLELPDTAETSDGVEAKLAGEELEARIQSTIASLPERCRVIFCLNRFEEKTHKEISEQLGISPKTIENQMTKALKILRAALQHLPIL